jgi:hypothetical protein
LDSADWGTGSGVEPTKSLKLDNRKKNIAGFIFGRGIFLVVELGRGAKE